jgi:formate hydrogenlyase subunit 4
MAGGAQERLGTMQRKTPLQRALALALVLALLVVLGEAGHVVLDQLNAVIAHHFFHLVFPAVAFIAFGCLVASDIRKRGWPTFSWRLAPSEVGPTRVRDDRQRDH